MRVSIRKQGSFVVAVVGRLGQKANEEEKRVGVMMDTLVERGTRERSRKGRSYSGGIECASSASTSYESFSPSHGDAVCTPSISEKRSDREVQDNTSVTKTRHTDTSLSLSLSHTHTHARAHTIFGSHFLNNRQTDISFLSPILGPHILNLPAAMAMQWGIFEQCWSFVRIFLFLFCRISRLVH